MEVTENCRICNSVTELQWPSNLTQDLSSDSFAITDAHYGQTSAIYKCRSCGFLQCNDLSEVLTYYEQLKDPAYEQGRNERYLQAKALGREIGKYQPDGRFLDVGAGSGILVEAALDFGYQAMGVEPSTWLQQVAHEKGLPVRKGLITNLDESDKFEVIALIDVIEHVVDPVGLLREIRTRLSATGIAVVVTPDCASLFARLMKRKWWHYRVAHIGYFNRKTLTEACKLAGLKVVGVKRPGWYFTMDYLWVRLLQYAPRWFRLGPFNWMNRITLPINLRDSLLFVLKSSDISDDGSR